MALYNKETCDPKAKKVAKVGLQFCQILNKLLKNCQWLVKFCQILNKPFAKY